MSDVEAFVQDIRMVTPVFADVINHARKMFADAFPNLEEKVIYGGVGFFYEGVHIGGIYPNKKHLNLVFSRGNELPDPDGLLLGKGKFRRFLRMTSLDSFEANKVQTFVSKYSRLFA